MSAFCLSPMRPMLFLRLDLKNSSLEEFIIHTSIFTLIIVATLIIIFRTGSCSSFFFALLSQATGCWVPKHDHMTGSWPLLSFLFCLFMPFFPTPLSLCNHLQALLSPWCCSDLLTTDPADNSLISSFN